MSNILHKAPIDNRPVSTVMKVRPDSEGLEADHVSIDAVVERANQLPGFDGWSSEIREIKTDFVRVTMLRILS